MRPSNYSTVIAMSGGVDSSVAAALAVRDGGAIAGLTMRLADAAAPAGPGRCCAASDIRDARAVAARLGLPHHVVDLRSAFDEAVVRPFVEQYAAGLTPIPCVACNDRIKFRPLLARARTLGAGRLVTGHYARVDRSASRPRLLRPRDEAKDQTYFLHGLTPDQLGALDFPLGELTKTQVREIAREAGLPVAAKPESQEVCFIPDGRTAEFVERQAERRDVTLRPGPIVDGAGRLLGRHGGVHRYTVGQRRGLGAHGRRLHVLELDAAAATVVAGPAEELAARRVRVERFNWMSGRTPDGPVEVTVRLRHGRHLAPALLVPLGEGALVELETPQRAPSRGQAAVAYAGEEVLGGGPISTVEREERAGADRKVVAPHGARQGGRA